MLFAYRSVRYSAILYAKPYKTFINANFTTEFCAVNISPWYDSFGDHARYTDS